MEKRLILGLTKIGDLLIDEGCITHAGEKGESIRKVKLKIPVYQRPYKWTVSNVVQLFDDINQARLDNREVYRVGTLILHRDKDAEEPNTYDIVDGQQRTITFALLLRALMETLEEANKDEESREGQMREIRLTDAHISFNTLSARNISTNYRALKRKCQNLERSLEDYLEYVINNCEMIVVITSDISEAFQFFDSQNARGKKLYPHDLLKAYHLREMNDLDADEVERIVKTWEDMDQRDLAALFSDYLYRVKQWIKGDYAADLNEHNIDMFKGLTRSDVFPYAQFYKGAYAYADAVNASSVPSVTGLKHLSSFQIDTPIVAGKPFFAYAKHYFDVLKDIQNNDKYEGCFINDNAIIKTLNLPKYRSGTGNKITRLILDTAILLYVDRFCLNDPSHDDLELLDQFTELAFIWAYSMRAQYRNVGWRVAQNFIMGSSKKDLVNSFNIYKMISDSTSPVQLLSALSSRLDFLPNVEASKEGVSEEEDGIYTNYLSFFKDKNYWRHDG